MKPKAILFLLAVLCLLSVQSASGQSYIDWDAHGAYHFGRAGTPHFNATDSYLRHRSSRTVSLGLGFSYRKNSRWGYSAKMDVEYLNEYAADGFASADLLNAPTGIRMNVREGYMGGSLDFQVLRYFGRGFHLGIGFRTNLLFEDGEGVTSFYGYDRDGTGFNVTRAIVMEHGNSTHNYMVFPQAALSVGKEWLLKGKTPLRLHLQWNQSVIPMFKGNYQILTDVDTYERVSYRKWHTNLMLGFAVIFKRKDKG